MLRFVCPACGRNLKSDDHTAGTTIHCPGCKQAMVVPSPVQADSSTESVTDESPAGEYEYPNLEPNSGMNGIIILSVAIVAIALAAAAVVIFVIHEKNKPQVATKAAKNAPVKVRPVPNQDQEVDAPARKADDSFAEVNRVIFVIPFLILIFWTLTLIWVVRDAKNRSVDNGVMWMLVIMFSCWFGLLIYLASRPHGHLILCNNCRNKRLDFVKTCPHCGHATAIP